MTGKGSPGRRVVVGVDGSPAALDAARWAAMAAQATGAELVLLWAVEPPVTAGTVGVGLPPGDDLLTVLQSQSLSELRSIADTIGNSQAQCIAAIGSASGVLIEHSDGADLLVVGSRGRGGFAGLLLGSVSTQVAPHAGCPVVVVRELAREGADTVVVGIDGSKASQHALRFAFDMASVRGWDLVVVHAWEVPAYDLIAVPQVPAPVPLSTSADDEVRLAAEALAGFQEQYPDVHVSERIVRGSAASALIEASTDAALLVVGTRGHGPAMGALLGSVSHTILHRAHVPVAVVPHYENAGGSR